MSMEILKFFFVIFIVSITITACLVSVVIIREQIRKLFLRSMVKTHDYETSHGLHFPMTSDQQTVYDYVKEGYTREEIANLMRISSDEVGGLLQQFRNKRQPLQSLTLSLINGKELSHWLFVAFTLRLIHSQEALEILKRHRS